MVLDRHLAVRQRARDVEQQPARNDDRPFVGDLRVDDRAQRHLHVGRCEMQLASFGAELDPAEHEHGRPLETPRATTASFDASSSRETVILSPVPTTVSESII